MSNFFSIFLLRYFFPFYSVSWIHTTVMKQDDYFHAFFDHIWIDICFLRQHTQTHISIHSPPNKRWLNGVKKRRVKVYECEEIKKFKKFSQQFFFNFHLYRHCRPTAWGCKGWRWHWRWAWRTWPRVLWSGPTCCWFEAKTGNQQADKCNPKDCLKNCQKMVFFFAILEFWHTSHHNKQILR